MDNSEKNTITNIEHLKRVNFWRSAFFGLVILIAGIAIGGASMSIMSSREIVENPPGPPQYNSLMPRLTQILQLRQQQIEKIRPILDGYMQHLYEIREDARVEITDTLEQMNEEIYPILGEGQRIVWSDELLRIQRQLNPEPPLGRGLRRGAGQAGQGARRGAGQQGQGGAGRVGRGGQLLNQRGMNAPRRGTIFQPPPPGAPNSPINNNQDMTGNEIIPEELNSIDVNE